MNDTMEMWQTRNLKLVIDGKELVIKPTMKHFREMRAVQKDLEKLGEVEGNIRMREIYKKMLATGFVGATDEQLDDWLDTYEFDFTGAFYEAIGLMSKATLEEAKKKVFEDASSAKEKR